MIKQVLPAGLLMLLGAAAALLCSCAEPRPGMAFRPGQPDGSGHEPAPGMESNVRYGGPSGRYARPSRASAVATRAAESDVR
jgi:hypothetical protein